jgi:glutamate racemase
MQRVGVLDWGIGGLGFVKLLERATSDVACVYLSDSGAPPYGTLTRRQLSQRVSVVANWFAERGIGEVVVACNAASSVLGLVSSSTQLSGVIEPTLRWLLHGSRRSPSDVRVGIFGGVRTIRSGAYRTPLVRAGFRVQQRVAQPLSALVEAGRVSGAAVERQVARILSPIVGCDVLVPACTHYAALLPLFERLAPSARFIDPAALSLAAWLRQHRMGRPIRYELGGARLDAQPCPGANDEFYTTGSTSAFRRGAQLAFGLEIQRVQKVTSLPDR